MGEHAPKTSAEGPFHRIEGCGYIKELLDVQRQGGVLSMPECPSIVNTLCLEGIHWRISPRLVLQRGGHV